jgi:RNA-binding protein
MSVVLTSRERAHLKARAHALEPTVQVGHAGITDALVAEADRALTAHELIKVKLGEADREIRDAHADALCVRTDAVSVQRVGKVIVLWRPRREDADESGDSRAESYEL